MPELAETTASPVPTAAAPGRVYSAEACCGSPSATAGLKAGSQPWTNKCAPQGLTACTLKAPAAALQSTAPPSRCNSPAENTVLCNSKLFACAIGPSGGYADPSPA